MILGKNPYSVLKKLCRPKYAKNRAVLLAYLNVNFEAFYILHNKNSVSGNIRRSWVSATCGNDVVFCVTGELRNVIVWRYRKRERERERENSGTESASFF